MRQAQMIDRGDYDSQGLIEMRGEPEDWATVRAEADTCEHVGDVKGWEPYRGLYRVVISEADGMGGYDSEPEAHLLTDVPLPFSDHYPGP